MTTDAVNDLFDAVESHAAATGYFDWTQTAEPKSAPGGELGCAVWLQSIGPAVGGSGLASTSVRVEFSVRIYTSMVAEPEDTIDPRVMAATLALMKSYTGDFGLSIMTSPDVRAIDLMGIYSGGAGSGLRAEAGYLNQDGKLFRVMTISLPIILNDLWTQTE